MSKMINVATFQIGILAACAGGCSTEMELEGSEAQLASTEAAVAVNVQMTPADGAVGVAAGSNIELAFDQVLRAETVSAKQIRLYTAREGFLAGAERVRISLDSARRKVTIDPAERLVGRYLVEIDGVQTSNGTVIRRNFSFTAQHNSLVSWRAVNAQGVVVDQIDDELDVDGRIAVQTRRINGAINSREVRTYQGSFDVPLETKVAEDPGPDGRWGTPDDNFNHRFQSAFDARGNPLSTLEVYEGQVVWGFRIEPTGRGRTTHTFFEGAGPDGRWLTPDDAISYYGVITFDDRGGLASSTYYRGPGPDGRWKTGDDEISSRTTLVPTTEATLNYLRVEAGADGRLGTRDDSLSRTRRRLGSDLAAVSEGDLLAPGPDGRWFTNDDLLSAFYPRQTVNGTPVRSEFIFGAGPDGVWMTGDDEVASYEVAEARPNGAVIRSREATSPGPDGLWRTGDDVFTEERQFDTQR